MRTVHETESARTAEHYIRGPPKPKTTAANTPIPDAAAATPLIVPEKSTESQPPASKGLKLKLNMNGSKSKQPPSAPADYLDDIATAPLTPLSPRMRDEVFGPLPPELQFDETETTLDRRELFRLLRRQIHWAEQDGKDLQTQEADLLKQRRDGWMAKELVVENLLEADFAAADRDGVFDDDGDDMTFGDVKDGFAGFMRQPGQHQSGIEKEKERILATVESDAVIAGKLPLNRGDPAWYRTESVMAERARKKMAKAAQADREATHGVFDTMANGDETEEEMY